MILKWGSLWIAFPSVSALLLVSVSPLDMNNSGLKILKMSRWPPASTEGHVYLLKVVSFSSTSQLLGILAKVIPIEFW